MIDQPLPVEPTFEEKIVTHLIKFEKLPNYLEFFEEKEQLFISFISKEGGEIKLRCEFSKVENAQELKEKAKFEKEMQEEDKLDQKKEELIKNEKICKELSIYKKENIKVTDYFKFVLGVPQKFP